MATTAKRPKAKAPETAEGPVAARVPGFALVKHEFKGSTVRLTGKVKVAVSEQAETLLPKVAVALAKPGLRQDAVFKKGAGKSWIYSYSLDTSDPSRVVRMDDKGKRKVGRLVGERFVPIRGAA